MTVSRPLVDTAFLLARRDELVLVDCRFVLGDPGAGERAYRAGHVPGAAFLDLDRDLAGPPGDGGRHPLPDAAAFEASARRAGISDDSRVIAYDEAGEGGAARLWWLLRHFGHADVAVLDGGLRGWREAGGELEAGGCQRDAGDFTARPAAGDIVSRSDVAAVVEAREAGAAGTTDGGERAAADASADTVGERPIAPADTCAGVTLLDARAPERYRGDVEPIDPVAGHIPGARNLPFAGLAPDGRFLAPEELRARFEEAGVGADTNAVAYCGSGVTATVLVLAAEVAGLRPPRLYPGSWSEWCRSEGPAD